MNYSNLLRKHLLNVKAYSSARDEFDGEASVFLDANENSMDIDGRDNLNRYPDPHQQKLKANIAALKGVSITNIFLGNGSDEAIDLLFRAFCEPGKDEIITMPPTYGMYEVSAGINNIGLVKVPLTPDFQMDLEGVLGSITANTKMLMLCSPNNPSGNRLRREDIIQVLDHFPGLVVLDEAYIDFDAEGGFLSELDQYPNLIILQTFSKAWGLAGLRIGMAFAHEEIIDILNLIKPPYNINALSQKRALEVLTSHEKVRTAVVTILEQRALLCAALNELALVEKVFPSDANFVLVKVKGAAHIYQLLVKDKIIVRDRSKVIQCDDCLRITIGTAAENNTLINALKKYSS